MDKLFTPNKWLVLFCAVFVAIYATLNWVINSRLQATAKIYGDDIFSWVWMDKNVCAKADMSEAKVLQRSDTAAVVEVTGEQVVGPFDGSRPFPMKASSSVVCKAKLTFYKLKDGWELGKVELQ